MDKEGGLCCGGSESQGTVEEGTTEVSNTTKKLLEVGSVRLQYGRMRVRGHSVKGRGLI